MQQRADSELNALVDNFCNLVKAARVRECVEATVRIKVLVGRLLLVIAVGWVLSTTLITFISTREVLNVRF
jgi:hypothetical protein